ncbi:hypothetical protein B7486_44550 [cyanobacterium TDX16]|nr:hypothetical protein B7486_44550 [cyanobacterium TDX16]
MLTSNKISFVHLGLVNLLAIAGGTIIFKSPAIAQIAPDNSLNSENSLAHLILILMVFLAIALMVEPFEERISSTAFRNSI